MRLTHSLRFFYTAIALLLSSTLFSFMSSPRGGEGFEVYLDGKVIFQRFGPDLKKTALLSLNAKQASSELKVRYYVCGNTEKNRKMVLKDHKDKLLREWKLTDAKENSMTCKVGDIINIGKPNGNILKLYYVSSDQPAGRLLTQVTFSDKQTVAVR